MYNYSPFGDEDDEQDGGDQSYGNASQPRTPTTTNANGASARNAGLAAAASPIGDSSPSGSLASVSSPVQGDDAAQQRAALNTNSLLSPGRSSGGAGERVTVNDGSLAGFGSSPGGPLSTNPNSGISGGMNPNISGQTMSTTGAASGAMAPSTTPYGSMPGMGAYTGQMSGFDSGKFGKHDPKYAIGAVESNFDPRAGISQSMLDQLNGLGIGSFSGKIGGDKFHIDNGDPAFQGVNDIDAIIGSKTGDGLWGYQPEGEMGFTAGAAQGASLMEDPVQLQLAQQLGVDTNSPYWKQILQGLMDEMTAGQDPNGPQMMTKF